MKRKLIISTGIILSFFVWACGGSETSQDGNNTSSETAANSTNDDKGIGSITHVELSTPLDQKLVETGKNIYNLKCSACHRLTKDKLVGPGWLGVTSRRKPEWIMNFATNAEEMLNKDATAMALLEECLVRMPNQNVSESDARGIVEFMRNNDGEK